MTSENLNLTTTAESHAAAAAHVRPATASPAAAERSPRRLWLAGFVAAFFAFGAAPSIAEAIRTFAPSAASAAQPVISVAQTAR